MGDSNSRKPPGGKKRLRIGEFLLLSGMINQKTLDHALRLQKTQKKKLGQILIELGVIDDVVVAKALSRQLGIPYVRLKNERISQEALAMVPPAMAEENLLLPIRIKGKKLVVAMANPLELSAIDDLRFIIKMDVDIMVAPESDIREALKRHYSSQTPLWDHGLRRDMGEGIEIVRPEKEQEPDIEDLLDVAELPPVIRFTNTIIADAIKLNASDIHIEPQEDTVLIRYRIDGVMQEIMKTEKHVHPPLVSRIKIISNLDISIRMKPQDGKSQVKVGNRRFDLRVSTLPTSYGEKVTIRILNPATALLSLEQLGFSPSALDAFHRAIQKPQGIILVTGPTGSGKSSTLYACINKLNSPKVNIVTVEDPVEYDIPGINQVQINPKAGITFAAGLRSILRQDPDIVLVGEIRDAETAGIAIQASMTGHLVFSTLHTNDAPSAVTRLLDLGVDAFLIPDALVAVVGQRLVRKICPKCKRPHAPAEDLLRQVSCYLPNPPPPLFKGAGCEACRFSGYSGRIAIFEILMMTPALKRIIAPDVPSTVLKKAAEKEGFKTMAEDGIEKTLKGITTLEEVLRVTAFERDPSFEKGQKDKTCTPQGTPSEAVSADSAGAAGKSAGTVLVVDDNKVIRKTMEKILISEAYRVMTAQNGQEALEAVSRHKPDLIITDYMMPVMDGMTLIKHLKAQLATRLIPIIMLTAKDEMDTEVRVIEAGADDYLTKPITRKRFVARVNRIMQRWKAGSST